MAQDQSSTALTPEPVAHPDDRASLPRPKWLFEYVYHFSEAAGPPHPAVLLLRAWLRDESGYDEAVWPELREALHEDRLSRRKLFR